jgi:hypothetical protein
MVERTIDGEVQNEKRLGLVKIIYENGDVYVGMLHAISGNRHGRGTYTYTSGLTKEGVDFKRGDKHILKINAKLNHWSPDMHFVKGDEKFISREGIEFLMKRDRQQKGLSLTPE